MAATVTDPSKPPWAVMWLQSASRLVDVVAARENKIHMTNPV